MMIIEKARELGIALSETEEFKQMMSARAALEGNEAVSALLNEFTDKQNELMEHLTNEDADRLRIAALSRDIDSLERDLSQNKVFAEVMSTQNAFQILMRQVNREISACIGMPSEFEEGCGGSCDGCSGCNTNSH